MKLQLRFFGFFSKAYMRMKLETIYGKIGFEGEEGESMNNR